MDIWHWVAFFLLLAVGYAFVRIFHFVVQSIANAIDTWRNK